MFFISQIGPNDCGFTCLKILLANYHHDKNYLFLPCKDEPYSFAELKKIASEHHMEMIGVKVGCSSELTNSKDFPFIATIKRENGAKHSVLLLRATRKHVIMYDPEFGRRRMSLEDFYEVWDSMALVIETETGHKRVKCPQKVIDFIDKKDKIILPIWQILSGVSLMAGLYFINSNSYFFIPIIFFALFIQL